MLAALSLAIAAAPADAKLEDLSFIVGSWSCPQAGGTFEEHWMPPSGGSIQGVGKLHKDGKTLFMEFLSIEKGEKGLVMWITLGSPASGPQRRAAFALPKLQGKEATFEDPKNDFPSKIVYKANADGTLHCRLTGTENGKPAADQYNFKPMKR